jgi:predicted DNA-binding transcriptional regulator AlpA
MSYAIPKRLSEKDAAEFLGIKVQTLQNWRQARTAPPYYKVGGKIIYDLREVEQWMEARRVPTASDRILVPASA